MQNHKLIGPNGLTDASSLWSAAWSTVGATVIAGSAVPPDGGNADPIIDNTGTNRHTIYQTASVDIGSPIMIRALGRQISALPRYLTLYCVDSASYVGASRFGVTFDLNIGAVGSITNATVGAGELLDYGITDVSSGLWFECWVVGRLTGAAGTVVTGCIGLNEVAAGGIVTTYTGTGSNGLYAYKPDVCNAVLMNPNYDFKADDKMSSTLHRTRTGRGYKYIWSVHAHTKFGVEDVSSSDKCVVNSWWGAGSELRLINGLNVVVCSGLLSNATAPIDQYMKPYIDQFKGTIELEGY